MLGQMKLIDCVVKEQGETDWRVVLEVHKGEWLRSTAFWMLEEKLNAYAGFILDGDMQAHYPGSTLETTHLVLASVDPLPDRAVWLMETSRRSDAAARGEGLVERRGRLVPRRNASAGGIQGNGDRHQARLGVRFQRKSPAESLTPSTVTVMGE